MKRILLVAIIFTLLSIPVLCWSGDLTFPRTEKEIIEALSIKDDKVVFEGVTYESRHGKVYKIIGNKRFSMRGLAGIADSSIVPKAGALIHFDFDSARIKPESYPLLNEFGQALTDNALASANMMIAGHTDAQGSDSYNLVLSEKRAHAVAEYLRNHYSIRSDRLRIKGFGKTKPVASNDTEEGRARNRRVEFIRID